MALSAGTRLGPYEILAPLGAGGMGEVYRARDTRLDRTVAIKVIPAHLSASPELRRRLEREAKAVSQLSHPHICTLYDVGREDDTDFLVMEYLEGETLARRLEKGPLALEQALHTGSEIAEALDKSRAPLGTRRLRWTLSCLSTGPGNSIAWPPGARNDSRQARFEGRFAERGYWGPPSHDVTLDGQRFVMVQVDEGQPKWVPEMVVIPNWFEELKEKMREAGQATEGGSP